MAQPAYVTIPKSIPFYNHLKQVLKYDTTVHIYEELQYSFLKGNSFFYELLKEFVGKGIAD